MLFRHPGTLAPPCTDRCIAFSKYEKVDLEASLALAPRVAGGCAVRRAGGGRAACPRAGCVLTALREGNCLSFRLRPKRTVTSSHWRMDDVHCTNALAVPLPVQLQFTSFIHPLLRLGCINPGIAGSSASTQSVARTLLTACRTPLAHTHVAPHTASTGSCGVHGCCTVAWQVCAIIISPLQPTLHAQRSTRGIFDGTSLPDAPPRIIRLDHLRGRGLGCGDDSVCILLCGAEGVCIRPTHLLLLGLACEGIVADWASLWGHPEVIHLPCRVRLLVGGVRTVCGPQKGRCKRAWACRQQLRAPAWSLASFHSWCGLLPVGNVQSLLPGELLIGWGTA